jgi:hypothetical protein
VNHWWISLLLAVIILTGLLIAFVLIARKGRMLRKALPLPPKASKAYLNWLQDGKQYGEEIITPFYFGKHPQCNIVLSNARAAYEICIFYHDNRFAVQTLEGAGELLVNGEEVVAGYLRDGDSLVMAEQTFTFHCS